VFSIYDTKSEVFGPPFHQINVASAERAFLQLCADERSTIYQFPDDFRLMHLGSFNDHSGTFTNLPVVLFIRSGQRPRLEVFNGNQEQIQSS